MLPKFSKKMTTNRQFTWEELVSLDQKHNAHIAIRGKVSKTGIGANIRQYHSCGRT